MEKYAVNEFIGDVCGCSNWRKPYGDNTNSKFLILRRIFFNTQAIHSQLLVAFLQKYAITNGASFKAVFSLTLTIDCSEKGLIDSEINQLESLNLHL
jgi:hypothetical protein